MNVLELGKALVKELKLDPGVDTLGRWMAHHIAELISKAENEKDNLLAPAILLQAEEAIIRLWTHRSGFDNYINPQKELKEILQVIRTLSPYRNHWSNHDSSVSNTYSVFRKLIICLIFIKIEAFDKTKKSVLRTKKKYPFLNIEEKELILALDTWLSQEDSASIDQNHSKKVQKKEKSADFRIIALSLIEEVRTNLNKLEANLKTSNN